MFFPLYWMLLTSFSPQSDMYASGLHWWPRHFTWDNYRQPIENFPVWRWFWNSTVIAAFTTLITVVCNLLAGYAFAKIRFRGRNPLFLLLLSTMMIPVQAVMVPQFRVSIKLGLYGNIWAVILPESAAVFGVFLARQFFLAIPDELLEAARVDGAGHVRSFFTIVLPLCKPLIAVLVLLTALERVELVRVAAGRAVQQQPAVHAAPGHRHRPAGAVRLELRGDHGHQPADDRADGRAVRGVPEVLRAGPRALRDQVMAGIFSGRARINYLSTMRFDDDFLKAIEAVSDDVEVRQPSATSADQIPPEVWAEVDVLHTSSVLCHPADAPRLRWVQLDTSGVDHLRAEPLWASDIPITTLGGVSPVPLAEYVMWAVLGTAHRMPALLETRAHRHWPDPDERWQHMLPAPVRGATLGILGYGRIGREVGRLARQFGMDVVGMSRTAGQAVRDIDHYDPSARHRVPADAEVEVVGPDRLHEVLGRSDYLVVVLPLTEQTAGMLDAAALAALKDQAVLINVARGGIVDEAALRDGLRSGRIRAAVLDVFDDEPLAPDDRWWDEPNVIVTPHVSGLAPAYEEQLLDIVSQNLGRLREGRVLMNLVDRAQGY